jgi:hypothetical protein
MDHLKMVAVMDVYCKNKNNVYSPKSRSFTFTKGPSNPWLDLYNEKESMDTNECNCQLGE